MCLQFGTFTMFLMEWVAPLGSLLGCTLSVWDLAAEHTVVFSDSFLLLHLPAVTTCCKWWLQGTLSKSLCNRSVTDRPLVLPRLVGNLCVVAAEVTCVAAGSRCSVTPITLAFAGYTGQFQLVRRSPGRDRRSGSPR